MITEMGLNLEIVNGVSGSALPVLSLEVCFPGASSLKGGLVSLAIPHPSCTPSQQKLLHKGHVELPRPNCSFCCGPAFQVGKHLLSPLSACNAGISLMSSALHPYGSIASISFIVSLKFSLALWIYQIFWCNHDQVLGSPALRFQAVPPSSSRTMPREASSLSS